MANHLIWLALFLVEAVAYSSAVGSVDKNGVLLSSKIEIKVNSMFSKSTCRDFVAQSTSHKRNPLFLSYNHITGSNGTSR